MAQATGTSKSILVILSAIARINSSKGMHTTLTVRFGRTTVRLLFFRTEK
jgi:hypothetical protein